MSNDETQRVNFRTRSRASIVAGYRPLVEMPEGRFVTPAEATIDVTVSGLPGLGRVVVDLVLADRRYRIVRLEATPADGADLDFEELGPSAIRRWLRHGIAHLTRLEARDGDTFTAERPIENPDPLWNVALTYVIAYAVGDRPTSAVAEELDLSYNAAAQRVKRARAAGFLPPTTPGKAS